MDLRCPQGYFHRLWNIGFRPADLARASDGRQRDLNDGFGGDDGDDEQEIPA